MRDSAALRKSGGDLLGPSARNAGLIGPLWPMADCGLRLLDDFSHLAMGNVRPLCQCLDVVHCGRFSFSGDGHGMFATRTGGP